MSTKELKIYIPEGYEVDMENSYLSVGKVHFKSIEQVNQQEFDEFFRVLLHGANRLVFYDNNYAVSILPTSNFILYDGNDQWLFEIRKGENGYFGYSYHIILPKLIDKFGVNEMRLNSLMMHVIEQVFGLNGVVPIAC